MCRLDGVSEVVGLSMGGFLRAGFGRECVYNDLLRSAGFRSVRYGLGQQAVCAVW